MTSNTRSTIIETIKTAVAKVPSSSGQSHVGDWFGDRTLTNVAASVLTALEASGMAVVPREPTQAMAKAGYEACRDIPRTGVVPEDIERAYDCWQAMVAAADGKAPAPQASAEGEARSKPNPTPTEDER